MFVAASSQFDMPVEVEGQRRIFGRGTRDVSNVVAKERQISLIEVNAVDRFSIMRDDRSDSRVTSITTASLRHR
jgi:hypothetical protein